MNRNALGNCAVAALLCGICVTFGPKAVSAAQVAASIEYDFVARPAGLPSDFEPREGTSLKFLAIKTIDGFQVDASLWQPVSKEPADTTLLVMVHGSGGSYKRPPQSAPDVLANAAAGAALSVRRLSA